MKSLIHNFFTDEAYVQDTVSTLTVYPQRLIDETGAFQVEVSQDPTAGSLGRIVLEGKIHIDASTWVIVAEIDFADFIGGPLSKILTDVPIVPYMRCAIRTASGGGFNDAATGTLVSAWMME